MEEEFDIEYQRFSEYIEIMDREIAAMEPSEQKLRAREDIRRMYNYIENYITKFKKLTNVNPEACSKALKKLKNINF